MTGRLYLFDDPVARRWEPFAATRPAGELLFGALLGRERAARATGLAVQGYLATRGLEGFTEEGAPPVVSAEALRATVPVVLLSTRYVPPLPARGTEPDPNLFRVPTEGSDDAVRLEAGGQTVGWRLPAGWDPEPWFGDPGVDPVRALFSPAGPALDLRAVEIPGSVLSSLWDLVDHNPDRLVRDLDILFGSEGLEDTLTLGNLPGVHRIGSGRITADVGVTVDPGAILDTGSGPIHLGTGVRVRPFTHLRGPALIGPGTTLLGGMFDTVSCGPVCKLRGEIEASVILGYSNKAHDGYLGHSILGRWVNLGAFTTNSDLKNNYGSVRVSTSDGMVDTGLLKLGVFLGDHVKTGIGTLVTAGTVIGAGTNIFGGRMPPKWIQPFSWGIGADLGVHRKDAFLTTAERAMDRRGVPLTPEHRAFLSELWERSRATDPEGAE
ncbi:MAG: hypothetical protein WD013_00210 [Gemmatimonadota bacterium]